MNLSPHFTLAELTYSEVALRQGIDNDPSPDTVASLTRLCTQLLEPVRSILLVPMHINSGYRSAVLNSLVGGTHTSAHLQGEAADFIPIGLDLRTAFDILRTREDLPYDQIIFECQAWIHIAIATGTTQPRRQALTATGSPGRWVYQFVTNGAQHA